MHTTEHEKITKAVKMGVSNLISAFQQNPYRFLYEFDLQVFLSSEILKSYDRPVIVQGTGHPENQYSLSPVNTEYFSNIDVTVLDVERCENYPPRINHAGIDAHLYELPVLYGIELKYRKLGDVFGIERCVNDLTKLHELRRNRGTPYLTLSYGFIQDEDQVEDFFSTRDISQTRLEINKEDALFEMVIVSPKKCWKIEWGHVAISVREKAGEINH